MLNKVNILSVDWKKVNDMIPVVVQHSISNEVLMHGYMNKEAFLVTQQKNYVTFYSRTKKRLWTKGEVSGNYLKVVDMFLDCDNDSLLILALPQGNTCHLNHASCFKPIRSDLTFFYYLECFLKSRQKSPSDISYTSSLHNMGINRISQKVAEEAIETVIAAITQNKQELINESTDLVYHLLVLLHHCGLDFFSIIVNLRKRRNNVKNID
ncbi:MAG: bifunctional phosphoribosyl-AMP cyclohydrolase/phosphoribosyl-ATP diphosphatase HisIE [Buchnera aphidicola (Schlechtendalia peitan)]